MTDTFVGLVIVWIIGNTAEHSAAVHMAAEVGAVVLAVAITGQIASDGESNWMEGLKLLAIYLILATVFFSCPPCRRRRCDPG